MKQNQSINAVSPGKCAINSSYDVGELAEATMYQNSSDRGFTGHRSNDIGGNDLGLVYMGARFYVSGIGRFASADTLVPDPTNPQSLNRYSYVLNSPVNLVDPSGHCPAPGNNSGNVVCVDFFIPTQWAFHLTGDNRGFSHDSDPSQSRVYFFLDVETGNLVQRDGSAFEVGEQGFYVNPSHVRSDDSPGGRFARWIVGLFGKDGSIPPLDSNELIIGHDETSGEITIEFDFTESVTGKIPGAPSINGIIRLKPDGEGGFITAGERDQFPSLEIYQYLDGELVSEIYKSEAEITQRAYRANDTWLGPLHLSPFFNNEEWQYPME